jgi:flagellar basal-body rod protein FlgG
MQTGYPLDLAIMGEGFLQIDVGGGRTGYSRSGLLTTDQKGRISTAGGHRLVPPVTVPTGATQLRITAGGEIRATIAGQTRTVGQIELARFMNPSGLISIGDNLLAESQTSGPPITGSPGSPGMGLLVQGALEASNVDLATEYVTDILSHLQLKANLGALKTEDEMLGNILDIKT